MDYAQMRLSHRLMMKAMCKALGWKKELTADDRLILEIYGKKVDFTDIATLAPWWKKCGRWKRCAEKFALPAGVISAFFIEITENINKL